EREAKVDELRARPLAFGLGDHDVRRLEIAVDEPLAMKKRQAVEELEGDASKPLVSSARLGLRRKMLPSPGREVRAGTELHCERGPSVLRRGELEHAHDARMVERREGEELTRRERTALGARRRIEHFEGDEGAVPKIAGAPDGARSAGGELLERLVRGIDEDWTIDGHRSRDRDARWHPGAAVPGSPGARPRRERSRSDRRAADAIR